MPSCIHFADTRSFRDFTHRMSGKKPSIGFSICGLEMGRLVVIWGVFVEEQLEIAVTIFYIIWLSSKLL